MTRQDPTIANLLARSQSRANALEDQHGVGLTYPDLARLSGQTHRLLAELGIGPDRAVAFLLRNGRDTAALFLGLATHCRVAPINPDYTAREIEFALRDLNAAALIVTAEAEEAISAANRCGVGLIRFTPADPAGYALETAMPRAVGAPERPPAGPDDVALLLHTSGTTARPKLVGLTHRQLWISARSVAEVLRLTPEDRCLSFMPFFHIHGLVAGLLASMSAGACVCCPRGFQATGFFSALRSSRATWYTAVPAMHQAILARAGHNSGILAVHGLRFIRSSSSPLHSTVWKRLESVFGTPVLNAYGMTEAAHQIASIRLPGDSSAPGARGSVGFSSGPDVAVMDADGVLLPPDARGEVVLRGSQILRGYLSPASANQSAFSNGWFRTGDEGVLSAAGQLTLTGRLKEMINFGGEKVAPAEIDEALMDHPAVRQALAFGLPCPARGERVYAAVVLDAEVGEPELRSFLRDRLAPFKVPERIIVVEEIPKGPTGKMQRIGMGARLGLVP
jgi:acyl-CoA synthetase (AMP-forming)/AMP-acid ligase II